MEYIDYPLLCYELGKEQVLGILVGTDYQMVERDVRNLRSALSGHLQRLYKKDEEYPYLAMTGARLRMVDIKVRPAYRSEGRSFPVSFELEVPVPVVYGDSDGGYFECYLPLMGESFFYYEAEALMPLVVNYANNYFNSLSPEEIYRFLRYPKPTLDTVTLKINPLRTYRFSNNWNDARRFRYLNSMTEAYPPTKAQRRQWSMFPEAAWELENKVSELVTRLVDTRSNVLVVGHRGVGKSAALRQAIRKIVQPGKEGSLTFWQLMSQRLLAQAKYLGEWQEHVEDLVRELRTANGILWVMDVMQLLQIGGSGPEDSVAAFLMGFLKAGQVQLVGEVTPRELEGMRRLLPGFVEYFQIVELPELPEPSIQNILDKFAEFCEQNLKITLERPALELSYRLLLRYYPYESFPGKAVKFLGQAVDEARLQERTVVAPRHVIERFVRQSGLPELFLRDDLPLDADLLRSFFDQRIIGQPQALDVLCGLVKIFKAGLNNPSKPIATLLFAGPTGVGKTAAAQALADYFFGTGQKRSPLIRLDMSEFQNPYQMARLFGAGNEVGKLVQDVRERPFSVLLLDEIEKAHPVVFDTLLTLLDEGMLVDAYGRTTNFRNTIVIMTSNLGASGRPAIGFGGGAATNYESAIARFFRPEFVNRIDRIVTFETLQPEHILQITRKELRELAAREGFVKRRLRLEFDASLEQHIAAVGFDERYGARPLQRAIENEVVSPLARLLLEHHQWENTTLRLSYDGELKIEN